MSLLDAVLAAGPIPSDTVPQPQKKRYSEVLSGRLALEVAAGLRAVGFRSTKPLPGGPGEKAFHGGLGPKKVDVSYADEQHGLLMAVSIKSINFPPFGKNLKNRFADLCTEAITLHMRFPYSVVCALFVFPVRADEDASDFRVLSTFRRAMRLFKNLSGRSEYTDPGEKFENVTMMLFQPVAHGAAAPWVRLLDCESEGEISEEEYFRRLCELYNKRNPHAVISSSDTQNNEQKEPS